MLTPTKREIVKEAVKEELEFLRGVLRGIGETYHNILRSYRKGDRGLKALETWYQYNNEDVWPILLEKRSKSSFFFPYTLREAEILNKLTKEIERIGIMLEEIHMSGRKVLYPEEVSEVLSCAQTSRIYMEYVTGRDYLTYELLDGKKVKEILETFEPTVRAFEKKLIRNIPPASTFYMGTTIEYAFLNLFIIDAYDNSLLRMLMSAKKDEEVENILSTYSPSLGLNRVLFFTEGGMKEYAKKVLRERRERKDLCLPMSLAQRVKMIDNGSKFVSYIQEMYGKNEGLLYI